MVLYKDCGRPGYFESPLLIYRY